MSARPGAKGSSAAKSPTPTPAPASKPTWDLFVRLFHWSLVACAGLNLFVLDEGNAPHTWVGYAAAGLVVARVVWGFIGSRHARFADFWPTPARVAAHLAALRRGQHPRHEGHNPLGALMILLLMGLVLALGVTGFMQDTDAFFGIAWVQDLHDWLGQGLMVAAGVHAGAALLMGRLERVRLVRAMVTGVKQRY